MDLKVYYKKVRDIECQLPAPYVVLYSLETPEGGRSGRMAEVATDVAARLITEGRSRVASTEEAASFYKEQKDARREADALVSAQRMQVVVVPQTELHQKRTRD